MADKKENRSVFIGNIPFDVTEQQIKDLCQTVGQVVYIRMITDKDTGKSKGFCFVSFADVEMARSAIRNLNNFELQGRMLRVAFAEEDSSEIKEKKRTEFTNNVASTNTISRAVNTLSEEQKIEILRQIKSFYQDKPDHCQKLLTTYPQLSQAILRIATNLNLLSQEDIYRVYNLTSEYITPNVPTNINMVPMGPIPITGNPQHSQYPPSHIPPYREVPLGPGPGINSHYSSHPLPQYEYEYPNNQLYSHSSHSSHPIPMGPDRHLPAYREEPQMMVTDPRLSAPAPSLPLSHQHILHEIMQLSPAQIAQLPIDVQHQIHTLKGQLAPR